MLLETLLSCTPREDLEDQSLLKPSTVVLAALDLISGVATDMNERKRESEGRTQLVRLSYSRFDFRWRTDLINDDSRSNGNIASGTRFEVPSSSLTVPSFAPGPSYVPR